MKLLDAAYESYLTHMDTRSFPECFESSRQFEEWQAMESIAHTKPRAFPCRDCTNEYHSQMERESRCALAGLPNASRLFGKG